MKWLFPWHATYFITGMHLQLQDHLARGSCGHCKRPNLKTKIENCSYLKSIGNGNLYSNVLPCLFIWNPDTWRCVVERPKKPTWNKVRMHICMNLLLACGPTSVASGSYLGQWYWTITVPNVIYKLVRWKAKFTSRQGYI